ncbi:MAG: hypothetical protein HGB05_20375 [Chloroflexi bacterium]|nr:hypothetical protein [Chloroflexota bacterium]
MFQRRKSIVQYLVLLAGGVLLAACAATNPIDTSAFTTFKHQSGTFSLQVPQAWKQYQADVPAESMAAFSEPDGRAELIGYAGLLDRRLNESERQEIVAELIKALLQYPPDLQITNLQRRPDGAYTAALSFTRANAKRSGIAIFRDEPLALSGVILSGPEAGWADFQKAMQPSLDSFKVDPVYVQGTYFEPLDGEVSALAIPAGWAKQRAATSRKARSPNGQLQIVITHRAEEKLLTTSELAERGVRLSETILGQGALTSTEQLPDGRLKVLVDQGARTTIGYLDQKDGFVIGLFFETPTDRVADYQAIIDFMYSTYITGK